MIDHNTPGRPAKRTRRRPAAVAHKSRKTATAILLAGAGAWSLLALAGYGGFWTTAAVAAGTGLSLAAARYLRQSPAPRKKVPSPRARAAAQDRESATKSPRPNAVTEDFNTLNITRKAPPAKPPVVKPVPTRPAGPERPPVLIRPVPPPLAFRQPVPAPEPTPVPAPEPAPVPAPAESPALSAPSPALPAASPALPADSQRPPLEPAPVPAPPAPAPALPALSPAKPAPSQRLPLDHAPSPAPPAPAPANPAASQRLPLDPAPCPRTPPEDGTYTLPTPSMLPVPPRRAAANEDEHLERAILLEQTLKSFGVEARVIDFSYGPAVTRYELQPGPGVRVNKFTALADDIALALAAEDIRVEAPIPGKSAVGIEVPNKVRQMVPLREVLESPAFRENPSKLAVAFGKDNAGNAVVGDLAKMPHLLIAGSTGSGKSVCMNTIICSLLFKAKPDEVKMLMIDPKMVELSTYNHVPHLIAPVVIDVRKAAGYLKGAVKEMEGRYELFAAAGVRNIQQYNHLVAADPGPDPEHPRQPLPFIVIFIDELADLMMVAPADVEDAICRLAQMARACGMHLVIATQSPRVDVITGLIKANVPSRIAFAVSSQIDSRVIMDSAGAERLLGRGDMLYHPSGLPKPVRAQGAFIDEASVDDLVRFVKAQGKPTFTAQEVAVDPDDRRSGRGAAPDEAPASAADAIFPQAVRVVIDHGQASVSILQRRLRCNYSKAARLIDMMEERGYVGAHQGSKPRDVLISLPQWQQEFGSAQQAENEEAEGED